MTSNISISYVREPENSCDIDRISLEFLFKLLWDKRNPCGMTSDVFKSLVASMEFLSKPWWDRMNPCGVTSNLFYFWNSCEMTQNIFTTSQHFHNIFTTPPWQNHHPPTHNNKKIPWQLHNTKTLFCLMLILSMGCICNDRTITAFC